MSPPFSGSKKRSACYQLHARASSTCSSETSVDFQRVTRRYIPQDRTLHNHRCENLESYTKNKLLLNICSLSSWNYFFLNQILERHESENCITTIHCCSPSLQMMSTMLVPSQHCWEDRLRLCCSQRLQIMVFTQQNTPDKGFLNFFVPLDPFGNLLKPVDPFSQ
jgi:hypothetical protein